MAIEHKLASREETITGNTSLIFVPRWENETSWEEVSLKIKEQENEEIINLGSYFIDSAAGENSWIEYNSNYVVFFGGNKYQGTTFITKIYDIKKREFVSGTIMELTEYYKKAFDPEAQCKTLIKITQEINS